MATKSSISPWADEPFAMIPVPFLTQDLNGHSRVHCASQMALSHNVLIRGLNAILQQAPYVKDAGASGYQQKDVTDLLYYVEAWVRTVHMHHDTEEECMFPAIERETGKKGLFDHAEEQHSVFTPGMDKLLNYVRETEPEDYRWAGGMKEIIDSFSKPLTQHLYEEIDLFLGFGYLDSEALRKGFDIGEEDAKGKANIMDMLCNVFPCVMGCADKTAPGHGEFPPLPAAIAYSINYFFYLRHAGAWRFNPCDFFGKPHPLRFGPAQQSS